MAAPLLEIRNLSVEFGTALGPLKAVDGVDLTIDPGEVVGIVGESGSGKSVAMLAVMGLLPWTAKITADRLAFQGEPLLQLSARQRRRLIGKDMAMIFQEPMSSLNPCFTVEFQLTEALRYHEGMNRKAARARALELLDLVGIPSPQERLGAFPHQLSGGMSQRVMIAMAIACNPKLLIADEPTTALDVTIQAQILDLLLDLQRERGMALILITHDMGVVAETVDRVVVQYAGQQVEAQAGRRACSPTPCTPTPRPCSRPCRNAPRRGCCRPSRAWCRACSTGRAAACSIRAARSPPTIAARDQPAFRDGPRGRVRCHYPLTGGVPEGHPGRPGLAA